MGINMFQIFRRKPPNPFHEIRLQGSFTAPVTAEQLMDTPRRRSLLENIWQRTSLSRKQFGTLYLAPLERYAALVQHLPASENHHHAYPGGMLDHGLEIVAYALKIRQTYLLPIGAPPESQAAQAEAWSAAAAYGALIHDIGKIAVDLAVELEDGKIWHPWYGPISQPYRFKYVKGRNYNLHSAAASLVLSQVMPPEALDWLSGFPELWSQLLFTFAGQYEHADILGEIVSQADQASVAQELGGNPDRAMAAPKQSLQRQLVDALRTLVKEKFKLNQPDGPSDGWLTQDSLWLVSKTAVDQLRAALLSQGIEHIPNSNAPMFNMMQDQAIIQTNAQDKAVWKVAIDTGRGWKNSFTVLKISPALIWPQASDRPTSYTGSVTVEQGDPQQSDPESDIAAEGNPRNIDSHHDGYLISKDNSVLQTPQPSRLESDSDHMDDLLSLFDDAPTVSAAENVVVRPAVITQAHQNPDPPSEASNTTPTGPNTQAVSTDDYGGQFLNWLKHGVISHKIIINDAKARVHTVSGTAFLVSPDIFKRYALEHPEIAGAARERAIEPWQLVQRSFEKKKRHRKTPDQLNIWTCEVKGPRKSRELRGYLLSDPKDVFQEVPYDNAILVLKGVSDSVASEVTPEC
ncbi:MobH family relaxase [Pseudomonas sp. NPDC088368]|uniref:MobH family relaxase n=1 Tax=Pseudomonas sp. NPDC088368 TaxID=3364453 RepID=UPI0038257C21